MKTIKPLKLGVLTRTFELDRKHYFVPTILAMTDFGPGPRLLPEMDLWRVVGAELGKDAVLDECMPKQKGEVLVFGKCFTPGGKPRPASSVRCRVGRVDKTLYVVGDRVWRRDGTASDPEPFTEMPISWARAFGGEGHAPNPAGLGFAPTLVGGREVHRLPNVEDPKRLLKSKGERPAPAGFGPYDVTWPERWSKIGTYDGRWLREQMPGFAADMDLSMWNAAPGDQQIDGYFEGDEELLVENMHPQKPRLEGRLPGFVGRCFVTQRTGKGKGKGETFREVPMRLDTVQIFPHIERCVLAFRGLLPTQEDDGDDIVHLVVACDDRRALRPLEHFRAALEKRLDRKTEATAALRDGELLPPTLEARADRSDLGEMLSLTQSENLLQKNLHERARRERERTREQVRAAGGDPDAVPEVSLPDPSAPPDLEEIPDFVDRAVADLDEQESRAAAGRARMEATLRKDFRDQGLDFDEEIQKQRRSQAGPPKFSADAELERLRDIQQMAKNGNVATPELDAALADPETERRLREAEAKLKEGYRLGAHVAEYRPARLEEPERSARRARVVQALAEGASLAGQDFCGADLSDLDLRGADFEGAFFEQASLARANLAGARLRRAVFAAADLSEADLRGADLSEANLGAATACGARFDGAKIDGVILTRSDLTGASLGGVRLEACDFGEVALSGAKLDGASFEKCVFRSNDLARASLRGVNLTHAVVFEVDLSGADFTNAILRSTTFLRTKLDGARFVQADLTASRFLEGTTCVKANLTGARADRATLRETDFSGADFSGASLESSDLSKARLEDAKLYRVNAKNALFMRADLAGASLVGASLEGAVFLKAKLGRADFRSANLFRADLLRAAGDSRTNFEDANVKQVRASPKDKNG